MFTSPEATMRPDGSPFRARSYDRQSDKRDDDSAGGPNGRKNACVARSAQGINGVPFAHTKHYEDRDRSGYDPKVRRPAFEKMLEDAKRGEFDVLVIFALSRLTRKGFRDALRIHDELQKCGVRLISVTEPFIDTGHPFGVAMFAMLAAMAHQSSADKSHFGKSANAAIREAGGWLGGRPSLGLQARKGFADGITIRVLEPNPGESPYIEELASRVLAKEAMHTLMEDYTQRGVPSVAGGHKEGEVPHWSVTRIHRILRDPRIAGIVGDVIPERAAIGHPDRYKVRRDKEGKPVLYGKGIITPKKWFLLQAELDRRSKEYTPRENRTRSLTGGLGMLKCTSGFAFSWDGQLNYVCSRHTTCPDHKGSRSTIKTKHLDEWLARTTLTRIAALEPEADADDAALLASAGSMYQGLVGAPELVTERRSVQAELAVVEREVDELYEDRRQGVYPGVKGRTEFIHDLNARTAERTRLQAALADISARIDTPVLPIAEWCATDDPDGDSIGDGSWWAEASTEDRQMLLRLFVEKVTVRKVSKKISSRRDYHVGLRADITWRKPSMEDEDAEDMTDDVDEAEPDGGTVLRAEMAAQGFDVEPSASHAEDAVE